MGPQDNPEVFVDLFEKTAEAWGLDPLAGAPDFAAVWRGTGSGATATWREPPISSGPFFN